MPTPDHADRRNAARRASGALLASLALVLTHGCDHASNPSTVQRTDSAGIEIVTNTAPDHDLGWSLDPVVDIHPPDGETEGAEGFFSVNGVAVSRDRIVVLDRSQNAIFVYDSLGQYQGHYGHKGNGPGELSFPLYVVSLPGGGVGVVDIGNRWIARFDASFQPLESMPLRGAYGGGDIGFAGDALVLPVGRMDGKTRLADLTVMTPTDTTVISSLEYPPGKEIHLSSCGMGFTGMPPLFSPVLTWTRAPSGDVLVAQGTTYDIGVYGGGGFEPVRHIRRDVAPIEGTKELAVRSLGDGMKIGTPAGERVCDPAEVVEKQGFEPVVPPLTRLRTTPDGDLWAARWVPKGDPPMTDVFDSTGVYLGTLTGTDLPIAFLGDDRVIVRRTDDMDVSFLTVYRVSR